MVLAPVRADMGYAQAAPEEALMGKGLAIPSARLRHGSMKSGFGSASFQPISTASCVHRMLRPHRPAACPRRSTPEHVYKGGRSTILRRGQEHPPRLMVSRMASCSQQNASITARTPEQRLLSALDGQVDNLDRPSPCPPGSLHTIASTPMPQSTPPNLPTLGLRRRRRLRADLARMS